MVNFWSIVVLVLLLSGGAMAIAWARGLRRGSRDDRADWENMLAECKNLRSQGVLGEDEYRKIRTLVKHRGSSS